MTVAAQQAYQSRFADIAKQHIPIQGVVAFHNGAFPARGADYEGRARELWIEGYVQAAVLQLSRSSAVPQQFHGKHPRPKRERWNAAEWAFLRHAWPTAIPSAWIAHLLDCTGARARQAAHTLRLKRPKKRCRA